ncbi:hypothetical protein BC936DRAFT_140251 [Jimgerdemannia flammicorona]|uniref:Uncharacterized protein n=1 Tax=Jimgerdemannia flammicorona TaxID=994334 RepID=A0A433DH18_9FUNG|nr:hypothetical protein BC936DRAFT_140251 [Jimgerdemannia flammicorona]
MAKDGVPPTRYLSLHSMFSASRIHRALEVRVTGKTLPTADRSHLTLHIHKRKHAKSTTAVSTRENYFLFCQAPGPVFLCSITIRARCIPVRSTRFCIAQFVT